LIFEQRIIVNQDDNQKGDICQLQGVIRTSPAVTQNGVTFVVRIKRTLKRHLSLKADRGLKNAISAALDWRDRITGRAEPQDATSSLQPSRRLDAGDLVRVRTQEDIQATLDRWRSLKGCGFLDEMANYCGTTQRVLKRVERFMDERDYRLKKASGIVLLDGVFCSGTGKTGRCDRACFFFWREEWLEKLKGPDAPKG
jgi:hypothetical protein